MNSDNVIIVSGDGHATPPKEVWKGYLEAKYHEFLPQAYEDSDKYAALIAAGSQFTERPDLLDVVDPDGLLAAGAWRGVIGDVDRGLEEMDREGVAAEMVYVGDTHYLQPFGNAFREVPQELKAAGMRVFDRWVADTFGEHLDRFYMVGDPAAGIDIDAMLAELRWTADHGFRGALVPGMFARNTDPRPLYDPYYDPFWAACVEYNMFVVCHAGHGIEDNAFGKVVEAAMAAMSAEGRGDLNDEMVNGTANIFLRSLVPTQALWQMMLGGVFDRFPDLRFLLAEIRGDWIPSILGHLDDVFDRGRDEVPATRRPSEYWCSNTLQSLSFVHHCEVGLRHEIGINNITFGRDYSHPEGTWPNTRDWLRHAFVDVPENELRLVLGENAIQMLNLDRAELAAIAEWVGPTVEEILGPGPELDPRMLESWDLRSGYLKPAETADSAEIDALLRADPGLAGVVR